MFMSDTTMFDSYRHVKELEAQGLTEACAKSIVSVVQDGFTHHVATKADLAELRGSLREAMAEFRGSVHEELAEFRGSVHKDMAEFRGSIHKDMANLRTDIASWKNELTWRILGGFTAIIGLAVAAMKLL